MATNVPANNANFLGKVNQTSQDGFTADKEIIGSVNAAQTVYQILRQNHLKRIALYAQIEGLVQGNPPYDPQELASAGLQHIANFNDMSALAVIERACLAYWNLLHNSQYLTKFVVNIDDPSATQIASTLSRNWDYAVKRYWPSFLVNCASLTAQLVKFGVSPALFSDPRDPRWRMVELSRFFVPDQAQADIEQLGTVCVETEFTVQYLWSTYQRYKGKPKDSTPWNTEALGRFLVQVSGLYATGDRSIVDIYDLERRYLAGDTSIQKMFSDNKRLISLMQKEYEGKISHYIFSFEYSSEALPNDFLYKKKDTYTDLKEALVIFTMNPGAFTIHANRGLGHKIFSLAQAKIMMDCSVVDMAKWASTVILKSSSLSTKDSDQIRFFPGVPTNIGSVEFVNNTLGANIQQVVGAAQYVSSLINYNITYSGSDAGAPDPDQGSMSPTQTRLQAFREFNVLKNNIQHFYTTFDQLVQNMTAKMLRSTEAYPGYEIAKCWKERCIAEGVPEEIFKINGADTDYGMPMQLDVYATRAAGSGSQVAQLIGLQELQSIAGSFTTEEEKLFKRMFIEATIGAEYLSGFMQESADDQGAGASVAGLENAIMQAGKSPIFSPDNNHRVHMSVHMALVKETLSALNQQQTDPVTADGIFNVMLPHGQEHMDALSKNVFARQFYEGILAPWNQFLKLAALNRKNAEKIAQKNLKDQQQAQQADQQAMTDEQRKNFIAQSDEQRKNQKQDASNQRQQQAGQVKAAALVAKTTGDLQIKRAKAAGEVSVQRETKAMEVLLTNTAKKDEQTDPSGYITKLAGDSPSPSDFK